ncbi:bifunctional hydroxymethylpyrimidine kinase/phosphomethylpyrimidine kinase [Paenibacillus sp. P96]|uniref:Hydroxymethylpyrimidine/phosphomethylpyrimidine kinase n=1 Tax=Paenibacillus zeirhizosphaerae TaxID=2987519 RepID=A0ABT9FX45_9BACL|nr:bifunctional hydroxymethylpyrimidine kinase/phosphomethylpyrimidine kinase [Paenibacillus sp. P96]MDP4099304.1 bifunctional hydroxymethylpyrimidine kinase/phosphomethylpyrimidine kinase [Paenibacillus sp. P96]
MNITKALTIAGSDSSGGAGIQADLKTFQELGVYGMSALTAATAQNTLGVQAVFPLTPEAVGSQLDSIGADLTPDAVKTGMLYSAEIIAVTADRIARYGWSKLVIDPVMVAKGGAPLLKPDAVHTLIRDLLPLARIITPNLPEAEMLTGMKLLRAEDIREAARRIHAMGPELVIMKGGHASGAVARDLLYDGAAFTAFDGPRIHTVHTHGTGCTYSAAVTAGLASGLAVTEAVRVAKDFIQAAIENSLGIGAGHGPTNHFAYRLKAAKIGGDME